MYLFENDFSSFPFASIPADECSTDVPQQSTDLHFYAHQQAFCHFNMLLLSSEVLCGEY